MERFPISFKTHFSGNYFHHVVLGIYCNGRYGSLGMSRRSDLMDKPLTYRTLSDLIFDFEDSYKKYLHSVKKVKIGLYVPHEPHSFQPIEWKQLVLNVSKMMRTEVRKELEKFARDMRMKVGPHLRAAVSQRWLCSPTEVSRAPRGAQKAGGEQTPGRMELPHQLVGLKSPEGKAGRWGCGVWLPFGMRGVPERASGAGKELDTATASGDLVPFQPSAGSRSRAGVLLSMGLALAKRYAAWPPSYSGFPAPALLARGWHPSARLAAAPVSRCHLSCPAE